MPGPAAHARTGRPQHHGGDLEVQLSQQKMEDADATLQRLRQLGAGSRELAAGERLWRAYRGDLQQELQQARLFAAGGRSDEALLIYRRLFNDDPPGLQLGTGTGACAARRPAGAMPRSAN